LQLIGTEFERARFLKRQRALNNGSGQNNDEIFDASQLTFSLSQIIKDRAFAERALFQRRRALAPQYNVTGSRGFVRTTGDGRALAKRRHVPRTYNSDERQTDLQAADAKRGKKIRSGACRASVDDVIHEADDCKKGAFSDRELKTTQRLLARICHVIAHVTSCPGGHKDDMSRNTSCS